MVVFWIAAALLSAVAAALVLQRAAGAARRPNFDPTAAVYQRQLTEIDDLADRGLLADSERKAARAEAARRLLTVADVPAAPASSPEVSRPVRLALLAAAVALPALAIGLYLLLGAPGAADQPFAKRLAAWRNGDPSRLAPAELAAVLETIVKTRPTDVQPLLFLARAEAAAGDLPNAIETLRKAVRLAPKTGAVWSDLGQALVLQGQGAASAQALAAFRQALVLDPKDSAARYHLARARIGGGDVAGGLADWRALAADLPPGAQERAALEQEIDAVAGAGRLTAPQSAAQTQAPPTAQGAGDQRAFIQSMVDRLAAKLKADPNDPAGWARLIRSYAVLGDAAKMQAATDQAHQQFKGRPDALKIVDDALAANPP